jgi:hypothetical protein
MHSITVKVRKILRPDLPATRESVICAILGLLEHGSGVDKG